MKFKTILAIVCSVVIITGLILVTKKKSRKKRALRAPNNVMVETAHKTVEVAVMPSHSFSFEYMKEGVLQHLDRQYTYDKIPKELVGGLLFQGIHRPVAGTTVSFDLAEPATVYFFFHSKVDGGYSNIFENLDGWIKCEEAPHYDINNPPHGLDMTMYKLEAAIGQYKIPPTTKKRACYNIVFQPTKNK